MMLTGDIGGTKAHLAIFPLNREPHEPLFEMTFSCRNYPDGMTMIREFLDLSGMNVHAACLGVAGPFEGRRVEMTNLPWVFEEGRLRKALQLKKVKLINDVEALAYAVPYIDRADIRILNPGKPVAKENIAVMAPGTGLGEAFLIWDGDTYRAYASEGGHANFGPSNSLETELWEWVVERFGYAGYERICSGPGIAAIFLFLQDRGHGRAPAWLREKLIGLEDPTPVIVEAALDQGRPCALCGDTLKLFVSVLAAEAGNLALKVLATGGVYLGGGILPRILPFLTDGVFLDAFRRKGRMSDLVSRIPVYVIVHPRAALFGAAACGQAAFR